MKIAKCSAFEGKPKITFPSVYGGAPEKPFMMRISVLGKRPVEFSVQGLPNGLKLCGNIVSGKAIAGEYSLAITVTNTLGSDTKSVKLVIAEGALLKTPLLGFTTWNAFRAFVNESDVESTAELMNSTGIAEYGYDYVNLDSGWQEKYGGKFDAVMPNNRFPDMKKMTDFIHSMGFKAGIYSTPMLTAWGCPKEFTSIPGCTQGMPDPRFTYTNGGIGTVHKEHENVLQWSEWGFDYLKYDYSPCDTVNADLMKKELEKSERDFAFCVTVNALFEYAGYWETHCNSWRSNPDTDGTWEKTEEQMQCYERWREFSGNGHFYDMDMLDIGESQYVRCKLSEDEKLLSFTSRAFFMSPIQISAPLSKLSEFDKSLFCNEEVIAVNQDALTSVPQVIYDCDGVKAYIRTLEDGGKAIAVFNMSDRESEISLPLGKTHTMRDLWKKQQLGESDTVCARVASHGAVMYKLSEKC